jgi:hypothetical protein
MRRAELPEAGEAFVDFVEKPPWVREGMRSGGRGGEDRWQDDPSKGLETVAQWYILDCGQDPRREDSSSFKDQLLRQTDCEI